MARALVLFSVLLLSAAVGAAPAANATTTADYVVDPVSIPKQLRAPPPHPPKVRAFSSSGDMRSAARSGGVCGRQGLSARAARHRRVFRSLQRISNAAASEIWRGMAALCQATLLRWVAAASLALCSPSRAADFASAIRFPMRSGRQPASQACCQPATTRRAGFTPASFSGAPLGAIHTRTLGALLAVASGSAMRLALICSDARRRSHPHRRRSRRRPTRPSATAATQQPGCTWHPFST
jgi:hypothetical protein